MRYIEIIVKLRKIIRSINLESKRIEKELNVSIPQLLCLQYLSQQEDYRALASQIKNHLQLNASTMSGIIKRLESKGVVARLPKPDDRRSTFITLTAKGADLLQASPTTLQQKLSHRLSKLEPEMLQSLTEHIDLLVTLMDASNVEAAPIITAEEL